MVHFNLASRRGDRSVGLRLTEETPCARIALRDFLECITDAAVSETITEARLNQLLAAIKRELGKRIGQFSFLSAQEPSAGETTGPGGAQKNEPSTKTEVVTVQDLDRVLPMMPAQYISRFRETGDLHRLQQVLRRESGCRALELISISCRSDDGRLVRDTLGGFTLGASSSKHISSSGNGGYGCVAI